MSRCFPSIVITKLFIASGASMNLKYRKILCYKLPDFNPGSAFGLMLLLSIFTKDAIRPTELIATVFTVFGYDLILDASLF